MKWTTRRITKDQSSAITGKKVHKKNTSTLETETKWQWFVQSHVIIIMKLPVVSESSCNLKISKTRFRKSEDKWLYC